MKKKIDLSKSHLNCAQFNIFCTRKFIVHDYNWVIVILYYKRIFSNRYKLLRIFGLINSFINL